MHEAGFAQPNVARPSQVPHPCALGNGAFHASPAGVLRFEALRLLAVPCRLERFVRVPVPHLQPAWRGRRLDAARAYRTGGTRCFRKPDVDRAMAMPILPWEPLHTRMALRTRGVLGLPVKDELRGTPIDYGG